MKKFLALLAALLLSTPAFAAGYIPGTAGTFTTSGSPSTIQWIDSASNSSSILDTIHNFTISGTHTYNSSSTLVQPIYGSDPGSPTDGQFYVIGTAMKYVDASGTIHTLSSGGGSGTVNSGTAGQMTYYAGTGTTVSGNANATISGGALSLGVANTTLGTLTLYGGTSGSVPLQTNAVAGSGIPVTLPAT